LNHTLDCPVCDQAGECGLQDYSYEYGQAIHRFVEERVVNPRKDVSNLIQLNMDRCIMCTRCVRFTREISQTGELEVMRRGSHSEIDIFPGRPIDNPLAGNVVDLCPVGALLDEDFLHRQRVWFRSKHDLICTRCSTGYIGAEENWRSLAVQARQNPHVNDYWIAMRGATATRLPTIPTCWRRCTFTGMAITMPAVDEAVKAVERGFQETPSRAVSSPGWSRHS
jgi:NADH-quinone oxidoreductase subunit G